MLELARILAGPWAGQTLADLGAEVIKVERPAPATTPAAGARRSWRTRTAASLSSAYNLACNRGKRSIAVDFETEDGQRIVKKLAARSDVLIENFKFGGLAEVRPRLREPAPDNPRLIYCSITGFGQDGPYEHRAGYDLLVQGMGGIMDITGQPDGEPMRLGVAFADVFTGVYSALAITAALKEREHTGKGSYIDMALLDSLVGVLANQALFYLVSGKPPKRMGNAHPAVVPYQTFPVHRRPRADRLRQRRPVRQDDGDARRSRDAEGRALHAPTPARVVNRDTLIPRLFELTTNSPRAELADEVRGGRRAGRPDQHARRRVRRPAGDRARHADRPAASERQGRHDPGRALADHHQRPPRRRRPRAADGRRAHGGSVARDRGGLDGPHFIHRRKGSPGARRRDRQDQRRARRADQHLQAAAALAHGHA